jgi:hypothetical protein
MELSFQERTCKQCHCTRPIEEFPKTGKNGRKRSCVDCDAKYFRLPRVRYNTSALQVRKSGREWALTLEQFCEIIKQRCHYCRGPLADIGRAMDRLDNAGGYTPDNVVPCCPVCNDLRGRTFTSPEMSEIGEVVERIWRRRAAAGLPHPERRSNAVRKQMVRTRQAHKALGITGRRKNGERL